MRPPSRRVARPALIRRPVYRLVVPAALLLLGGLTVLLLLAAGGVLLGLIPYPGR